MALTAHLRAEYEDGFTLIEDDRDLSPYDEDHNIFHAIVNDRPVAEHGPLKVLSLVMPERLISCSVPVGATPIRLLVKQVQQIDGILGEPYVDSIRFGYELAGQEHVVEVR